MTLEPVEVKKTLNTEITEEQAKLLENIPMPVEFKNKKLFCRIWNEDGTRTLLKPIKVPYGKPYFTAKVGGKKRYFKVNYYVKGMIKNIDGKMYYDTAFDNTTGGFALRNHEFPEDMDSAEAYTVFQDNAVNMYVKKGGIPLFYLLIAMGLAMVCVIAIIVTVPAGLRAQDQVKELDKQVTSLKQENAIKAQEIQNLRSQLGAS